MKKTFIIFFSVLFCFSCGNNSSKDEKSTEAKETTEAADTKKEDPEIAKGMELIAKSDCLTCHKLTEASIGPPYAAVAAKYKPDPAIMDTLAQKIIKGGSGNWGTVPMAPHVGISNEDAKAMVTYIMSVKN